MGRRADNKGDGVSKDRGANTKGGGTLSRGVATDEPPKGAASGVCQVQNPEILRRGEGLDKKSDKDNQGNASVWAEHGSGGVGVTGSCTKQTGDPSMFGVSTLDCGASEISAGDRSRESTTWLTVNTVAVAVRSAGGVRTASD